MKCKNPFRLNIELKFFNLFKYEISFNGINLIRFNAVQDNKSDIIINNTIPKRKFLFNIKNLTYDPNENEFFYKHLDFKYFDENIIMLTLTKFKDNFEENETIKFKINNIDYTINLKITNRFSKKQTFLIFVNNKIIKINHKKYDFNIIQTHINNKISLNKFYSINTILNYIPEINYEFYNNGEDTTKFLTNINPILLTIYNKLKAGALKAEALKADLFRALYIYYNGGIYFDCKNILYNNIYYLLDNDECYVEDLIDGIYNGFLFCSKKKFNSEFKKYINHIIYNIFNSLYLANSLEISGPQLLKKYIKTNIFLKNKYINKDWMNNFQNDEWKNSYLADKNNNIIIKTSYYQYYEENNYLVNNYYNKLWHEKNLYNSNNIDYSKINYIDYILFINEENSDILKNINIPVITMKILDNKILKDTLSNYDGNYFMICYNNILFDNLLLFNNDLKDIIINCPEFDILIIGSNLNNLQEDVYKKIDYNEDSLKNTCFIVSKNILNKDIYNVYVYKYNFIKIKNDFSELKIIKNILP